MFVAFALALWLDQGTSAALGEPRLLTCAVPDDWPWVLFARPQKPRHQTIPALAAALKADGDLVCYRDGTVRADLSTRRLRELFGKHVKLSCAAGAGNSARANAYFGRIADGFVPGLFKDVVVRFWIEDDPKFEVVDQAPTVRCPRAPRR